MFAVILVYVKNSSVFQLQHKYIQNVIQLSHIDLTLAKEALPLLTQCKPVNTCK